MRRSWLLLAGLLASAASAQVSVLSSPPGTSTGGGAWGSITGTLSSQTDLNTALSGKAGLSSNNIFTGTTQTISGATGLNLTINTTAGGDGHVYFANGGTTYGDVNGSTSAGLLFLVTTGLEHRFYVAGAQTLGITGSGLNLLTGKVLSVNGATVIDGSGFLQAASFPALTGNVTTAAGSLATTIAPNAVTYAKMQSVTASRLLGNPTGSGAVPSEISLAGGLAFSGTTLTAAGALTPTSVASTGAISGTSIAGTTTILSSGATSGIGYATGAGGAVTQLTSRVTGVTNNKACGAITLFSAAGSATWATFTVTDSAVAATDTIIANEKSGTNLYMLAITAIGAGTFNLSFATTGGTATDSPIINYCVIKGVAA